MDLSPSGLIVDHLFISKYITNLQFLNQVNAFLGGLHNFPFRSAYWVSIELVDFDDRLHVEQAEPDDIDEVAFCPL